MKKAQRLVIGGIPLVASLSAFGCHHAPSGKPQSTAHPPSSAHVAPAGKSAEAAGPEAPVDRDAIDQDLFSAVKALLEKRDGVMTPEVRAAPTRRWRSGSSIRTTANPSH